MTTILSCCDQVLPAKYFSSHLNSTGWASWAIWAATKKYNSRIYLLHFCCWVCFCIIMVNGWCLHICTDGRTLKRYNQSINQQSINQSANQSSNFEDYHCLYVITETNISLTRKHSIIALVLITSGYRPITGSWGHKGNPYQKHLFCVCVCLSFVLCWQSPWVTPFFPSSHLTP